MKKKDKLLLPLVFSCAFHKSNFSNKEKSRIQMSFHKVKGQWCKVYKDTEVLRLEVPTLQFLCDDTAVPCLYLVSIRCCGPDVTAALCVLAELFTDLAFVWSKPKRCSLYFPSSPCNFHSYLVSDSLVISKISGFHNVFISGETSLCHVTSLKALSRETIHTQSTHYLFGPVARKRFHHFKVKHTSTHTHVYIHSPIRHHVSHVFLSVTDCVRANQKQMDYPVYKVCSQHLKCTLMWQRRGPWSSEHLLLSFIAKNQSSQFVTPCILTSH